MTDLHKAAESLLAELGTYFDAYPHMQKGHVIDAITALREALAAPQPDSTATHSCSYYCDRPDCIKAQRDELREALAKPVMLTMTPDKMRAEWRDAGGGIYGPRVETVTMPEADYFAFRRSLAKPAVPPGYALVPVEPTPEMLHEFYESADILPTRAKRIWAEFLAAAPQPKDKP